MKESCFINFDQDIAENHYLDEFTQVLKLCIYSYDKLMIDTQEIDLKTSQEDPIRNLLVDKYLRRYKDHFSLACLIFKKGGEISNPQEGYITTGRVDINIENALNLCDEECCYTIECKRLDGYSSKNVAYVQEGLLRFINEKYSKEMPISGMIAFVQEFQKKGNINNIVSNLKILIDNCSIHEEFHQHIISYNFKHSYKSAHRRSENLIDVFHIFYDFTVV
jgi:hypothetical protein